MLNINNSKVLVTGGSSMIGRSVIKKLKERNCEILQPTHSELDLLKFTDTIDYFVSNKPEFVIHAAGFNGNISFNKVYPQDIFFRTTTMGLNVLTACSEIKVKKVVSLLASCAYRSTDETLKENEFLIGNPDQSVEAHGLGKRNLFIMSKQANKQNGLNAVCTVFNTAYGPFDNFNVEKTKVVGGMIKKFLTAVENKDDTVICWGTGTPKREIIFCDDAAEGVVQVLEKYDDVNSILNIGFNEEITIKELSEKIAFHCGFTSKIEWDTTKPDGQMRKLLDSSKMLQHDIKINQTSIDEGLKNTIDWYKQQENK